MSWWREFFLAQGGDPADYPTGSWQRKTALLLASTQSDGPWSKGVALDLGDIEQTGSWERKIGASADMTVLGSWMKKATLGGTAERIPSMLYDPETVTGMAKVDDTGGYTLGTVIQFNKAGYMDAIGIYKPTGSVQTFRRCGVYDLSGTLIAQGTLGDFANEPVAGQWIWVSLDQPVSYDVNDSFVIAATVANGYSSSAGDFTTQQTIGDITIPASADVTGNGRFNDTGSNLNYPSDSFGAANYFLNVRYYSEQTAPSVIPSGYPNATNTGASGTLSVYSGPSTINTPNTTIENQIINGSLLVTAAGFVLRNCEVNFTDSYGVDVDGSPGDALIEDCTITGPGVAGQANAGILGSGTFRRNKVSAAENGIVLGLGASTVTRNYVFGLRSNKAEPHFDGITAQGNQDGVLIQANTVISSDTSCIFVKGDFGDIANVTIDDNFCTFDPDMPTRPASCIYVQDGTTGNTATGILVTNNKLVLGGSSYYTEETATPATKSGNVNAYSLLPV